MKRFYCDAYGEIIDETTCDKCHIWPGSNDKLFKPDQCPQREDK